MNVVYDVVAATVNHIAGNHEQAKEHWKDAATDGLAMAIPGLPAGTSRHARREVMREEGIPTSQQPKSQSQNASGREYSYEMSKEYGEKEIKSVQQQTMDRSHQEEPHWEAGNTKESNGKIEYNKYGRPKLKSTKSKVYYEQ